MKDSAPHSPPSRRWWLHPRRVLACGFGLGLSPWAPGTCGTLLGVVLYLAMAALTLSLYLAVLAALAIAGVGICGHTAEELDDSDPGVIVWDEVVGFLTAMIAAPAGWAWIVAGFVLFRFFDIVKPWPVKAAERLRGGLGILLDDVAAGVQSLLVLQVAALVLAGEA